MKKYFGLIVLLKAFITFLLLSHSLYGQVGFNMVNATKAITTTADSNYFLSLIPEGDTMSWRDRFDKGDEQPSDIITIYKWLAKYNRHFTDLFQAGDKTDNIQALTELVNAGIPITAVEFVNEAFYASAGYNFTWSLYEPKLIALCDAIKARWPFMIVSIPLAPRSSDALPKEQGGSSDHKRWNDAAFAFEKSHPQYRIGYSVHIYFTGKECEAMGANESDESGNTRGTFPTDRVYDYTNDLADEAYYKGLYEQADLNELWEPEINYIRRNTAAPIYVSEFGYVNAGYLNGSWVYAAKVFEIINTYGDDQRIETLNIHAGPSLSGAGSISPRKTFDVRDKDNRNNVSSSTWDAVTMYLHQHKGPRISGHFTQNMSINAPGIYSFWFSNGATEILPEFNLDKGLTINDRTITCIKATHYSSISRSTGYTTKGSVLGPDEVSGIIETATIPPLSFGYVTLTITGGTPQKDTVIITCTDSIVQSGFDITINSHVVTDSTKNTISKTCKSCAGWWYRLWHNKTCNNCDAQPAYTYTQHTVYDTVYTPKYISQQFCDTVITSIPDDEPPPPPVNQFQDLNADTLYFHNETEFRDFLKHYNKANYEILAPKYACDCHVHRLETYYRNDNINAAPDQSFLYESWTAGMCNSNIKNHPVSGKMQNTIFESTGVKNLDVCQINETWKNPNTGQVVMFYDTFNWWDRRGESLFNTNLKLWLLWGLDGNYTYPLTIYDSETGTSLDYEHSESPINTNHLRTDFGYLLIK